MTPEEVADCAESFGGVRRKGTAAKPAWYVRDRLVVRLVDPATAVVRVPLARREELLAAYPQTFGVPPRMESHHEVEAYLDHADPAGVREAIRLAWELQRR